MDVNETFTVDTDNEDKAVRLITYGCNKCKYTCYTVTGYETHMFHSHRVRNVDKYPPTVIKKTMASPSSHEITSSDDANNTVDGDSAEKSDGKSMDVKDDEVEASKAVNSAGVKSMEVDSGSVNLAQVHGIDTSVHEGQAKSQAVDEAKADENANEVRNENNAQGTGSARNRRSVFSTPHVDLKLNFFCDQCDASFVFKTTYDTHAKEHLDELRPFKCAYCPEAFFYQGGLTHHESAHKRQIEKNGEVYGIDSTEGKTKTDSTRGRKRTRGSGTAARYRSENLCLKKIS